MEDTMKSGVPAYRICVAPMMRVTHSHFRHAMRLITHRTLLYTEMYTSAAIFHNPAFREEKLAFDIKTQNPIALQLGGRDPEEMAIAASYAAPYGYDEINVNVGCPSSKVAGGKQAFGAALMLEPELVKNITYEMYQKVRLAAPSTPVTVKCRIGVDHQDDYETMREFVRTVSSNGVVSHFQIHARKAWLNGLNTRKNRTVPPLKYDYVYRLIEDFPDLKFSINGGITTNTQIQSMLDHGVDGVMIGRGAWNNPWMFWDVDRRYYGCSRNPADCPGQVIRGYQKYLIDLIEKTKNEPQGDWAEVNKAIGTFCILLTGVRGSRRAKALLLQQSTQQRRKNPDLLIDNVKAAVEALTDWDIEKPFHLRQLTRLDGEESTNHNANIAADDQEQGNHSNFGGSDRSETSDQPFDDAEANITRLAG
eukprot:Clim_evm90s11 gene=Clim_evmTU90s11